MKVLLSGSTGLLGKYIMQELNNVCDIVAASLCGGEGSRSCDIRDESKVEDFVTKESPDIIIHTAAVTDVDLCESDFKLAHDVNAIGTRNLAWSAAKSKALFIYISTDYVFNGEKKVPYTEEDTPCPINVYGVSKLGGEKYVDYFTDKYYILRTSLIFGEDEDNFVYKVAQKLKSGSIISVAGDQIISPTCAYSFAQALRKIIDPAVAGLDKKSKSLNKISQKMLPYGVYNIVNKGFCSRYDIALKVAKYFSLNVKNIEIKNLSDLPYKAPRPKYCVLSPQKFQNLSQHQLKSWEEALGEYLSKL